MPAYGRAIKDYIGENTAKGTIATAFKRYNVVENSMTSAYNKKEQEARWGNDVMKGTYSAGEKVDGSIPMELTKQTLMDIMLWFGFVKDGATKVYNWSNAIKYLTIVQNFSDEQYYETSKDCRLGSVKINIAKASIIKAECTFAGITQDQTNGTFSGVSTDVTDKDTMLYGSNVTVNLGTDITGSLVSGSINFDNGLDLEDVNLAGNRKDIGNGDRKVTIELTMDFEKVKYLELKNKDKTNQTTALNITIGTLSFDFLKCSIDDVKVNIEGKNKVKASLKLQLLDNGTAIPMKMTDTAV